MPARVIRDTVRDKDLARVRAHNDGRDRKVIEYHDGTEITTEKIAPGQSRADGTPYLKEVRAVTRTRVAGTHFYGGFGETKYKRGLVYEPEEERHG